MQFLESPGSGIRPGRCFLSPPRRSGRQLPLNESHGTARRPAEGCPDARPGTPASLLVRRHAPTDGGLKWSALESRMPRLWWSRKAPRRQPPKEPGKPPGDESSGPPAEASPGLLAEELARLPAGTPPGATPRPSAREPSGAPVEAPLGVYRGSSGEKPRRLS